MDILVDGEPCPIPCQPTDRLEAVFAGLETAMAEAGRVIIAVEVGGEDLTPARRSALGETTLADAPPVRVATAEPLEVAAAVLRGLAEALTTLKTEQQRAAEALQAGRRARSMAVFRGCVEVWTKVQESVVNVAHLMGPIMAEAEKTAADLTHASEALKAGLERVQAALEADDSAALSDIIEADLGPLTDRWQRVLSALADAADAARQRDR